MEIILEVCIIAVSEGLWGLINTQGSLKLQRCKYAACVTSYSVIIRSGLLAFHHVINSNIESIIA